MKIKSAIAALAALAQDSRLAIFRLLVETGPRGMPAGAIGEHLGIPPMTLSFHLSRLRHAGIVTSRRNSRWIIYSANFATIGRLVDFLVEDCCKGGCKGSPPAWRSVRGAAGLPAFEREELS